MDILLFGQQGTSYLFLGRTSEERALVDQWLEFRVNRVDRCSGKTDIYLVLKVG